MRKRILFSLIAAAVMQANAPLYSAETNLAAPASTVAVTTNSLPSHEDAEKSLTLLKARLAARLKQGKDKEADFADILKDFDSLLARYSKTDDDRLNILFIRAQFYLADLDDPIKALPLFEELRKEYPDLVINSSTDLFLAGLQQHVKARQIQNSMPPGTPFPDFDEKDLQGNPLSVAKFKGNVVLVDFWATWCTICVVDLPKLQKAYDTYHSKGFEVIGISMDEDKSVLEKFIKQKKIRWPQYFEGVRFDGKLATKYAIEAAPTAFLIDREGKIIKRLGQTDDVAKAIEEAMKKN